MDTVHVPVLLDAVMAAFSPLPESGRILDCTVGAGGHSVALLERCSGCELVGIDADSEMLAVATDRLADSGRVRLVHGWFDEQIVSLGVFDRVLLDAGVSMVHMRRADRGFSLRLPGPLDMRIDRSKGISAAQLLAQSSEQELADLIFRYGEERYARRIARAVKSGARTPETTAELENTVYHAVPVPSRRARIHPATRTFQALRIAVNDELGRLQRVLPRAAAALGPSGRLAVITFHSLEDRLVKHAFRALADTGGIVAGAVPPGESSAPLSRGSASFRILTKKPIVADESEVAANPASRSAKLRVLERVGAGDGRAA